MSSVVAEGAKEETTKKPLRREAGRAEMECDEKWYNMRRCREKDNE